VAKDPKSDVTERWRRCYMDLKHKNVIEKIFITAFCEVGGWYSQRENMLRIASI